MMKQEKMNNTDQNSEICLVSLLFHIAFIPPFSDLQKIVSSISNNYTQIISVTPEFSQVNAIKSKNTHIIVHKPSDNAIIRIIRYILLNFHISLKIFLTRNNYDSVIFFCEQGLFFPMIVARLFKKKIYWLLPSSTYKMTEYDPDPLYNILFHYHQFSFNAANYIVLFSPRLISEWGLEKFRHKILIAPLYSIDINALNVTTSFSDRPPMIGYIGRLSAEKGVMNFVQALPAILNEQKGLRVFIGGEGPLKEKIEELLQTENLTSRVDLAGWIPHEVLPQYMNQLQLMIIPSYTESGPIIMLEAMACGTVVLATPVGSVTDVIIDGKNGFMMKDNSPQCIADNVIRVLNSPNLKSISKNGRLFSTEKCNIENSIKQWKKIFDEQNS
jgi:glycosyltransferase involved in cell wall biosynthesis